MVGPTFEQKGHWKSLNSWMSTLGLAAPSAGGGGSSFANGLASTGWTPPAATETGAGTPTPYAAAPGECVVGLLRAPNR